MELGLTLGDTSSKPFDHHNNRHVTNKGMGFCMSLSINRENDVVVAQPNVVQLDLLPNTPVPRNPWRKGFDVNKTVTDDVDEIDQDLSSSPNNSAASSFHKREFDSSKASDDEENGSTRKKLRLSKEQSAFLEESFKEHNTLNPKQKLALAKQLNLRPRQVEVWFQNRRARTKLKQTEVDCEYLKRCCETLTEENRRLHKELQELRALKTSNPFYMQLPATTLTMCPSCERVATTSTPTPTTTTTATTTNPVTKSNTNTALALTKPNFFPFSQSSDK